MNRFNKGTEIIYKNNTYSLSHMLPNLNPISYSLVRLHFCNINQKVSNFPLLSEGSGSVLSV